MQNLHVSRLVVVAVAIFSFVFFSVSAVAQGGGDLFKSKCAACHGADGSGKTAMGEKMGIRNLGSPEVQKQSDGELNQIITKGKNKMVAYEGKLTPEQISDLVKYIRTLKK